MSRKRKHLESTFNDNVHVAIICALGIESDAVQAIFDEIYDGIVLSTRGDKDQNAYTLGRIGRHYAVLAHLSNMGKIAAATIANSLKTTFGNIKLALVVGICGGGPRSPDGQDLFLGDIAISTQVVQADFGRAYSDGIEPKAIVHGGSRRAPAEIAAFLHQIQTKHSKDLLLDGTRNLYQTVLLDIDEESPASESDLLFESHYIHKHHRSTQLHCQTCNMAHNASCQKARSSSCSELGCEAEKAVRKRTRPAKEGPSIHFGPFISMDVVLKDGSSRDAYVSKHKSIAFEMEAAAIWEILPAIVIKGVSDYADSQKSKQWQRYAAATAASCTKIVLSQWQACESSPVDMKKLKKQMTREQVQKLCLDSLHFDQIDVRYEDIRYAHPQTCEWVHRSDEFISWRDEQHSEKHHRLLWIRGKPGSGKSTIMKHLYESCDIHFPSYLKAAFFFHARGNELQKTRLGSLRSVLYQLLSQDANLMDRFITFFRSSAHNEYYCQWKAEELENFLLKCAHHNWLKNTVLFFDALDEGGEIEARQLTQFFQDLRHESMKHDSKIFICLSIRHYPNIGMKHSVQLDIDDKAEHARDIRQYTISALRADDPVLVDQLIAKAAHVFLWTVLTIQALNQVYVRGGDLCTMLSKLNEIPETLDAVFKALILGEGGLSPEGILMFQWVLFAETPLHYEALYALVMAGLQSRHQISGAHHDLSATRIRNWITTESRGLIEVVSEGKLRKGSRFKALGQVQAIHESVHDLLRVSTSLPWSSRVNDNHSAAECHEVLATCCLNSIENHKDSTSIPEYITTASTCLDYVQTHLPYHIEQASLAPERFAMLLQRFVDTSENHWQFYSRTYQPLSVASSLDWLLSAIIWACNYFTMTVEQKTSTERLVTKVLTYHPWSKSEPVRAAWALARDKNWSEIVQILIDADTQLDPGVDVYKEQFKDIFHDLSVLSYTRWQKRDLIAVKAKAAQSIVSRSSQLGIDINSLEYVNYPPLITAVEMCLVDLVRALLEAGAERNVVGLGLWPLCQKQPIDASLALYYSKPEYRSEAREIISLLVTPGARTSHTKAAFHATSSSSSTKSSSAIDKLIAKYRRINSPCKTQHVEQEKDESLSFLLSQSEILSDDIRLQNGADPHSKLDNAQGPLELAVKFDHSGKRGRYSGTKLDELMARYKDP